MMQRKFCSFWKACSIAGDSGLLCVIGSCVSDCILACFWKDIGAKIIFTLNKGFFPCLSSVSHSLLPQLDWKTKFSHNLLLDIWVFCWDFYFDTKVVPVSWKTGNVFHLLVFSTALSATWFLCCKLLTFEHRAITTSLSSAACWVAELLSLAACTEESSWLLPALKL